MDMSNVDCQGGRVMCPISCVQNNFDTFSTSYDAIMHNVRRRVAIRGVVVIRWSRST